MGNCLSCATKEDLPTTFNGVMSTDKSTQMIYMTQLRQLLSKKNPPIQEVIDSGVVPRIIEFLANDDDPALQFEATWALTNIASGTSENIRVLIEAGAVPKLVRLLSSPVREQPGSTNDDLNVKELCDAVILTLPSLLEHLSSQQEKAQEEACWLIACITAGTRDQIKAVYAAGTRYRIKVIFDNGIIPHIVQLLTHAESGTRKAAAQVITNVISGGNILQRQYIEQQGCITPLRKYLGDDDVNVKILREHTLACNMFKELTEGYNFTTKWERDRYGNYKLGEEKTEWVDMAAPRPCSYEKFNRAKRQLETIPIGSLSTNTSTDPPVEWRGITLRQLRAADSNIDRRCEKEVWRDCLGKKLTPKTVNLYDVDEFLILPFTNDTKQSFVSRLPSTAGPQPPRFFVSHWSGETVSNFIKCIEQFIRDFSVNYDDEEDGEGGGMSADTPIWISTYANNHHASADDYGEDQRNSLYGKPMQVAEGRTITIVDNGANYFTRIWCVYDLFQMLIDTPKKDNEQSTNGVYVFYTAHNHNYKFFGREEKREAVGIGSTGATCDCGDTDRIAARESHFPFNLIRKSLGIRIEDAQASKETDRIHILNSIIGRTGSAINGTPPATHEKYTALNDALKATFVSSVSAIQLAVKEDDKVWVDFITALSKGEKDIKMRLDFREDGWKGLTEGRTRQLAAHLPPTMRWCIL